MSFQHELTNRQYNCLLNINNKFITIILKYPTKEVTIIYQSNPNKYKDETIIKSNNIFHHITKRSIKNIIIDNAGIFKNIVELSFEHSTIDREFSSIIKYIINNNNIIKINISHNRVCTNAFDQIVPAIVKSHITHIIFTNNTCSTSRSDLNYKLKVLHRFIYIIKNTSITHFRFGNNNFDPIHLLDLVAASVNSKSITHLNLDNNRLNNEALIIIETGLRHNKLITSLSIRYSKQYFEEPGNPYAYHHDPYVYIEGKIDESEYVLQKLSKLKYKMHHRKLYQDEVFATINKAIQNNHLTTKFTFEFNKSWYKYINLNKARIIATAIKYNKSQSIQISNSIIIHLSGILSSEQSGSHIREIIDELVLRNRNI